MSDYTAIELQARSLSPAVSPRLVDHSLNFFSRAVFSLVLAFAGFVLATVALLAGVVGAPLVAAVVVGLALRRRHAARAVGLAPTS